MSDQKPPATDSLSVSGKPDARWAFERYEQIRHRLPPMPARAGADSGRYGDSLQSLFDEFDAFVLDGFGVLNVGMKPVDSAAERLDQMRTAGKIVMVITNGATFPSSVTAQKYRGWELGLRDEQVISSRDALTEAMAAYAPSTRWGVAAADGSQIDQLPGRAIRLSADEASWQNLDGFVLLSSLQWTPALQQRLQRAMQDLPRPLLIGNPDLVAPHEDGLSLEPGFYGHLAADFAGAPLRLFGKPAPEVFAMCQTRINTIAARDVPGKRIAMVGDSLHTDVLGAAAFGWRSVLVVSHGLFRNEPVDELIATSGISPDFVVHHT